MILLPEILGTKEAEEIVGAVEAKVKAAREDKTEILFTRDTHGEDYLATKEGRSLPVVHCVKGTDGSGDDRLSETLCRYSF